MLLKSFLIFLCIVFTSISAQKEVVNISHFFPIEQSHSSVRFQVSYMGVGEVTGNFKSFQGTVFYNEKLPEKTSVTFRIDTESLNTDNDWRDKDLKSEKWIDVKKYPEIMFQSVSSKVENEMIYVEGNLTIHGVTKEVILPLKHSGLMEDERSDLMVVFAGDLKINRHDFKVKGTRWGKIVGDDILISINMLCKRGQLKNMKRFVSDTKKSITQVYNRINESNIKNGIEMFQSLPNTQKRAGILNIIGYIFMLEDKGEYALQLMQENARFFSDNPNVYDSLGEAQLFNGFIQEAKKSYQKAVELNPKNVNSIEILRHL